jgi:hypothetical protein
LAVLEKVPGVIHVDNRVSHGDLDLDLVEPWLPAAGEYAALRPTTRGQGEDAQRVRDYCARLVGFRAVALTPENYNLASMEILAWSSTYTIPRCAFSV